MKAYQSYKESGVVWLGELPTSWIVKRIKHNTYVKGRIGWQGLSSDEYIDSGPYLVTGTDFVHGRVNWDTSHHISIERYNEDPYIQLKEKDLLITKDGTIGKIALIERLPYKATLNSGVFVTRPLTLDYITPFMYWVLNSNVFYNFIGYIKTGSTVQHLYQRDFSEFSFPVPPLPEQQAIADFLDHKTAQIDTLIAKKQRKIELLQEYRTALINQAVTKGLDPNVPMKNSGVEWLGLMPKQWKICQLKFLTEKIGSGITPKGGADNYQDGGIPFIRSQNVHFEGLNISDIAFISNDIHQTMVNSIVYPNDILINITGASIGRCTCVPSDFPESNVNQHVCIIRPNYLVSHLFLNHVLSSKVGQIQVQHGMTGAARDGINYANLSKFLIPLPTYEEQLKITNMLSRQIKNINSYIKKISELIERLKEYRTALISAAVTGKIDVRE